MSGGIIAYTPFAPEKAFVSAPASVMSATKASAPFFTSGPSRCALRPTTRTWPPAASNFFATSLPVFPVAPVITYISSSVSSMELEGCACLDAGRVRRVRKVYLRPDLRVPRARANPRAHRHRSAQPSSIFLPPRVKYSPAPVLDLHVLKHLTAAITLPLPNVNFAFL